MKKPVIENSDNVIKFLDRVPEEYREGVVCRGFARWKNLNHRLQIESKRIRESGHSESEIYSAISEAQESALRPQLSLSECRELGIPINGDVVITFGSRRNKSCP